MSPARLLCHVTRVTPCATHIDPQWTVCMSAFCGRTVSRMAASVVLLLFVLLPVATPLTFADGAYRDLVVNIEPTVPADHCRTVLSNLEAALGGASKALYTALDGQAHWASVVVLLPSHWPDTCTARGVVPVAAQGERPDVRVGPAHPVHHDGLWTQQSRPCGQAGDFVYIGVGALLAQRDLGRVLLREFAKYRYGIFDEIGYARDPVYPSCYHGDLTEEDQINGCSDKPIQDAGTCKSGLPVNASLAVDPEARSSLLFAADSERINRFCDTANHDRFAPTKQNSLCGRRSVSEMIRSHKDFAGSPSTPTVVANTTPSVTYKRETLTRYVIVIEDTKDMLNRESWNFLRLAIRKWVVVDLLPNTEVGLVAANESSALRLHGLSPLQSSGARDLLASNIPYTPGDSHAPACLSCGIALAKEMLEERMRIAGPASSVIVVIAPGTMDRVPELSELTSKLVSTKTRIATINYPAQMRAKSLDWLAAATGGVAYTVTESRYNMATSFLSTYFKLTNVMRSLAELFYQGDKSDLAIEIHRRELTDDGRTSVTGSFVLEHGLGEPARFTVLTHNTENPLIRAITLVSPSHRVYSTRSDSLLPLKLLSLPANINETGSWSYTIERFPGSPQPHYVQVMATPWSRSTPVVQARIWTSETNNPLVLYSEVKRGDWPVLGARVEVTVTGPGVNGSNSHRERFELIDTGSGDPDLMKGDGIYSRYFNPAVGGPGLYTFEVTVTDNGNTAYSWQHETRRASSSKPVQLDVNCCGSNMVPPSVEPLSPFQRVLPPVTISFTSEVISHPADVGRVGDLRTEVFPSELKARLSWTAPDMGGSSVAKYELKYATTIGGVLDGFDGAQSWAHGRPFPMAPGSETTFTLDLTKNPSLLDQNLYIAVRGYKDLSVDAKPGPVSNWVRVNVPSPPPPPPPPSTFPSSPSDSSDPTNESVIPRIAESLEFNMELILPLVIGVILLALCLALYCYFCAARRNKAEKTKSPSSKHPEKPLNVSIVPTTQNGQVMISSPILNSTPRSEQIDSRILPPQFEPCLIDPEDPKKRYSVAHYSDSHIPLHHGQNGHMSVISGNPTGNGTLVRGRTLSPYQSWTASQLLHEHERRHSPYGQVDEYLQHQDQYPPPVPPLPSFGTQDGIYGTNNMHHQTTLPPPGQFVNSYHRNNSLMLFNPSLQGSLSSVSSGDRKKRNVTMV